MEVGGRSDVFNASSCLESANLVIALAGVSSLLFASGCGFLSVAATCGSEPGHEVRQGYPLNLSI